MRQARDLLYRKVHLGSNPNPGASPVYFYPGGSHNVFSIPVTGQPGFVGMKLSPASSSTCFIAMLSLFATIRLLITSPQARGYRASGIAIAIAKAAPASAPV